MQPRIQYAKTSDGASVAYWALGEGGTPWVLLAPLLFSNVHSECSYQELASWYEHLAQYRVIVRHDPRGQGMSDRNINRFSLEGEVEDLHAVVTDMGLDEFNLVGFHANTLTALAYASEHPERVKRLVIWSGITRTADAFSAGPVKAMMSLLDKDWDVFVETYAHVIVGWSNSGDAHRWADFIRSCIDQTNAQRMFAVALTYDVAPMLGRIRCATLVLHGRSLEQSRRLTTAIPNAHMANLLGDWNLPWANPENTLIIEEFLDGKTHAPAPGQTAPRTVLFTDLVGHTEMMSRLGDERGRDVLRQHEAITREVLKAHGGTEVKTMGDGFMASFGSVTRAVECAVALQKAFADWNAGVGAQGLAPLQVRCGLNAGEPIEEDGDLFGATVILASRIAAKAEGGEILVADTVRGLCSGKGFLFSDRGEFVAKGFEEPVRVYEVTWR